VDTLYDVLGIVPAASHSEVIVTYQMGVARELHGGEGKSSLWWNERLDRIAQMTEAMKVLVHGDRRTAYNKKLAALAIICSLCQGQGINKFEGDLQSRTCMACGGSGKALKEY